MMGKLAGLVRLAGLLGVLGLAGCSLLSRPALTMVLNEGPLPDFILDGRISVRTETQSFSGSILWTHRGSRDDILLSTPLGQGVLELQSGPDGVTLTDSEGRRHQDTDAESLLARHLGMRLPLAGLLYWLDARPRPGSPHVLEASPEGRPGALSQDGWRIAYGRYVLQEGRWLPRKLFAQRGEGLEFRLAVDEWRKP